MGCFIYRQGRLGKEGRFFHSVAGGLGYIMVALQTMALGEAASREFQSLSEENRLTTHSISPMICAAADTGDCSGWSLTNMRKIEAVKPLQSCYAQAQSFRGLVECVVKPTVLASWRNSSSYVWYITATAQRRSIVRRQPLIRRPMEMTDGHDPTTNASVTMSSLLAVLSQAIL